MELVIGTKAWSSWSLRPWLVLKRAGVPFTETVVRLRWADTAPEIAQHSPSGRVPVLKFDGWTVWDSLAICEYVADRYPEALLWPADPVQRAVARAVTAEMHSGFAALRNACPMDLALRTKAELSAEVEADVRRIVSVWSDRRREAAGSGAFLFGEWGIADAFYTPVATRFRSYGVDLAAYGDADGTTSAYASALLSTPEFLEWEADASV